jgi:hypothetical protein
MEGQRVKLLVGTLYCGENEYEECVNAIRAQTFQNFDHITIENLPELEAHYSLYGHFLEHADQYDLLVKIDADVVLNSEDLFEGIFKKFTDNPWLEVMNIGVDDFFTGEMIAAGIQVYRNTVRWDFSKDTIFTDVPIMDPERYLYDKTDLAPAAVHCKNPSPYQAFHYGVHRGLKSIQRKHSTSHWALLNKVWQNFLKVGDRRIGLAVLGAELVYAGEFGREDQNYTQPKMKEVLSQYEGMDAQALEREIRRLRALHWGFLPDDWRRRVLRLLRGRFEGRWDEA